jgi:outer membrane protein TolC
MSGMGQTARSAGMMALALAWAGTAAAEALTVDQAVQMALERNVGIIGAAAGLDEARSAQYSALAGVLPSVSLSATRSGFWQNDRTGTQVFGGFVIPTLRSDLEQYSTSPTVNASWQVLNLSSLSGVSASRTGVRAAANRRDAARNDISFATRQKFYDVVRAIKTAVVNANALGLARDEERRVRALFEVGSVSRSDVLQAQVRTAQSELDSLVSHNRVTVQRNVLADQLGIAEEQLGDVDTTLTTTIQTFDEAQILAEAREARPDLMAAAAEHAAARASMRAANLRRLPYVSLGGSATLKPTSSFKTETFETFTDSTQTTTTPIEPPIVQTGSSENELQYSASIALNWNIFDGLATDAGIAASRARLMRAESASEQLSRNLAGEVRQVLLTYREATEGLQVAIRALESAEESHKLIQQKYNVGSATILELINAQVQLQRAANDEVTARAAIKVAEAAVARVRGRSQ